MLGGAFATLRLDIALFQIRKLHIIGINNRLGIFFINKS